MTGVLYIIPYIHHIPYIYIYTYTPYAIYRYSIYHRERERERERERDPLQNHYRNVFIQKTKILLKYDIINSNFSHYHYLVTDQSTESTAEGGGGSPTLTLSSSADFSGCPYTRNRTRLAMIRDWMREEKKKTILM